MAFDVALRVNEDGGRFIRQDQGLDKEAVVRIYAAEADTSRGAIDHMCMAAQINGKAEALTADGHKLVIEAKYGEPICGDCGKRAAVVRVQGEHGERVCCTQCGTAYETYELLDIEPLAKGTVVESIARGLRGVVALDQGKRPDPLIQWQDPEESLYRVPVEALRVIERPAKVANVTTIRTEAERAGDEPAWTCACGYENPAGWELCQSPTGCENAAPWSPDGKEALRMADMETDHSGQFISDIWHRFDPNARVADDGTIRASVPRDELVSFREFLNGRGWELTGQQDAGKDGKGRERMYCKATPKDGE